MATATHLFGVPSSQMNDKETELLEAIGMRPARVLTRRPLTVAVDRHAYLPGLLAGVVAFEFLVRRGVLSALLVGAVAGVALTVSLAVHECGHLLVGRHVRGITPRILLMRSGGGIAIVEGRYEDARGAALFAAAGPFATFAVIVVYTFAGVLLGPGPLRTGLALAAVFNALMLVLNLLPLAPTDGYMLFRAALWGSVGNRAEAEERAMRWGRSVLLWGLVLSMVLFLTTKLGGLVALFLVASLIVQQRRRLPQPLARTTTR